MDDHERPASRLRHTPDGGVVTLGAVQAPGGAGVLLWVADTGEGIPKDRLEKIFDPGYTTKGVGVGTGLGLSLARAVARVHGGDIEVVSRKGQGSTFTVTLPVMETQTDVMGKEGT